MAPISNETPRPRIIARPLAWHLAYLCATLITPVLILAALSAWFYVRAQDAAFTQRQGEFAHIAAASLDGEMHRLMIAAAELVRSQSLLEQDVPRLRHRLLSVQSSSEAAAIVYDANGR